MPVGVCAVRSDMVVSVGMRDRMRVDVAAVEMREGVLGRQDRLHGRPSSPEDRRRMEVRRQGAHGCCGLLWNCFGQQHGPASCTLHPPVSTMS